MISFDLKCSGDHRFEGWFGSSSDFDSQRAGGLLVCPVCDDHEVSKALSVPNVGRKGNQVVSAPLPKPEQPETVGGEVTNASPLPPAMAEMIQKLALAQNEMLKDSRWVGGKFAETARAIHYGEEPDALIHGETSRDEAEALLDEGISVASLPFPFVPPQAKN
jgi:hypothetical protein